MDEKLDFSLPEKKRKSSPGGALVVLLLLAAVVIGGANLYVALSGGGRKQQPTVEGLSASQARQLATKLGQRSLYERAADVWLEYLKSPGLTDDDRAKALFQVGTLFEKAGRYDEAIEYYYRSEATKQVADLGEQINTHVRSCFENLGKFSALRYELMDRTSMKKQPDAGSKVVAEIGPEKITDADLSAAIENAVDNQLEPVRAFMTDEQIGEQKKKALDQYKSPQARQQYLESWLAQEVLYREALADKLTEKEGVKKLLDNVTRGVLSQQLMNEQIASKVHITDTDLQTYYEANKSKYVEPEKASISHILVADKDKADAVLKRLDGGEKFDKVAADVSLDAATKNSGGAIDSPVVVGQPAPVIGDANGLNEAIFATDAGKVIDKPFKTDKGWEIVKVRSKSEQRQKGFDEVRQDVMMSLMNRKRQDVQQEYVKQMMDKYNVVIHTSAFAPQGEEKPKK